MEYDLIRLFEHPLKFRRFLPAAIVIFGGNRDTGQCEIAVEWKMQASGTANNDTLTLSWDVETLRPWCAEIDEDLHILRTLDDDRATQVMEAAVIVAVAVMAHVEPNTRFTRRSATHSRHDYYLNGTDNEMIEIAGRSDHRLASLFKGKKAQSDGNPTLRKRWVSVTIVRKGPRKGPQNRTEGLHP
jgi:hypothetical protein